MSAPRPPGRPSAAVYRRRRLVFGVGALAVILALVLLIVRPGSGTPAAPSATPTLPLPTVSASASVTPTPTPTPKTIDVSKLATCDPELMEITPLVDGVGSQAYGPSAKPALSFSIKYTGTMECYYNVGTNAQVFTITSGAETYWKSTDCQSGASETLAIFKPGQTEKSAPFAWNRTLSTSRQGGTCDAQSPVVPKPASYNLKVSVGAANSPSTAQMVFTN